MYMWYGFFMIHINTGVSQTWAFTVKGSMGLSNIYIKKNIKISAYFSTTSDANLQPFTLTKTLYQQKANLNFYLTTLK